MTPEFTPSSLSLPVQVQAILAGATRCETPCRTVSGSMVWHLWGQPGADASLAPLLLLHGGSGSWTHWLRNIDALVASGRRVLVPDLPGFGDSAAPLQGRDADALPELLAPGLQCLLGDAACDVAGFSFGGMVAGLLAAQWPARVARLVLVGAPGLGIAPEHVIRLKAWRHKPTARERDDVHRHNLAVMMLFRQEAITEIALRLQAANVARDRMQGRSLSRTDVLACALAQVKCPVWAIYGAEDALYRGRLAALAPALQQASGFQSLALVEDAGHWVQFERAEAFNAALLDALDSR